MYGFFFLKVAVGSRFSLAGVGVLKEMGRVRSWLLRVSYQVQVQVQVQVELEVQVEVEVEAEIEVVVGVEVEAEVEVALS